MMSPQKIFAVAGPGSGTGVTPAGRRASRSSPAQETEGDSRLRHFYVDRHLHEMLSESLLVSNQVNCYQKYLYFNIQVFQKGNSDCCYITFR